MRKIYIIFICLLLVIPAFSQDFHFMQSLSNTFLINPASAGHQSEQSCHVSILSRSQWSNPGSEKGYQGAAATVEWRHCLNSSSHFFALGMAIQHDWSVRGAVSNSQILPAASYHMHLGHDWFIAAGASVGILGYSLKGDNLKFDAQYQNGVFNSDRDNKENLISSARIVADMGSGFECYNNRKGISLGISWLHLNKPVYSFIENTNNLGISFIAHGTVSKVFNNKGTKSLSFKALLRRQSFSGNNSRQWMALTGITGGLPLIEYAGNILQFGIAARWGGVLDSNFSINALVPNFTYLNNAWSLSLSYDINTSGIKTQFAGGMELSTTYSFGKYDKCINCPSPYFSPAKNNIRNK